jgi:hypothetical protein
MAAEETSRESDGRHVRREPGFPTGAYPATVENLDEFPWAMGDAWDAWVRTDYHTKESSTEARMGRCSAAR